MATRYLTLLLGAVQSYGIIRTMENNNYIEFSSSFPEGFWRYAYLVTVMLAGAMLTMWLGDQITDLLPTSKRNRESSMKLIEKMKSTRPTLVVAVANLLPIIPNGIIPYIAARSSIRNIRFTEAIMATCWIQIFFNCLAGGFLKHGQIGFMIGALAIQILLLVVVSKEGNRIMDWALRIENKLKSKNS